MKSYPWLIVGLLLGTLIVAYFLYSERDTLLLTPHGGSESQPEKPYDKYSFTRLSLRDPQPGVIEIGPQLFQNDRFTSYLFHYTSDGRRISGQVTIPNLSRTMAVVVMARGYADKEGYVTGLGTRNAAYYYASEGYIAIAPDFAGYGSSDQEDTNPIGARLARPVEILDLIDSLNSLSQANLGQVYLWGHSNGGQIMLSVAEILSERGSLADDSPIVKGVTLWAPVSKPFPYSILYYTDEADDQGKYLRGEIAQFEREYDVYDYSIDQYYHWLTLPVQIHQGLVDDAVPDVWSNELVEALEARDVDVTYHRYPGADHNLQPGWNTVVVRDVDFFTSRR